jgi:hypothetical protein
MRHTLHSGGVAGLALAALLLATSAAHAAPTPPASTVAPPSSTTSGPTTTTAPTPPTAPTAPPSGDRGLADRLRDRLPFPFGNGPGFLSIGEAINGWFRDLVASSPGAAAGHGRPHRAGLPRPCRRYQPGPRAVAGLGGDRQHRLRPAGDRGRGAGHDLRDHADQLRLQGDRLRLALALLGANLSLVICGQAIELANALARALLVGGTDAAHVQATLRTLALAPLDTSSGLLILVALVIAVMVLVLVLVLVASCVVRVSLLIVLVAGAPLALACHALPRSRAWRGSPATPDVAHSTKLLLRSLH